MSTAEAQFCENPYDPSEDYVCENYGASCYTEACDNEWSDFSECSVSCGEGIRRRMNSTGFIEDIMCNSFRCDADLPQTCDVDIVFAVDSSSSITSHAFAAAKQMVADIVKVLPTGSGGTNVGYFTYALEAEVGVRMLNISTDEEIVPIVWDSEYTGGSTYSPNALEAAWGMLDSSSRAVTKILVTVTDGPGYLDEIYTGDLAEAMQYYSDIQMYAIQVGNIDNINIFATNGSAENVFPTTEPGAHMRLASAILKHACGIDIELRVDYTAEQMSAAEELLGRMSGGPTTTCTEYSDYSACSKCGVIGRKHRVKTCTTPGGYGESYDVVQISLCLIPCPTLPPPTTNAPEPLVVDCSRCDFTKGQVWQPDPLDCHMYYICEKIDSTIDDTFEYRIYHMPCGATFWDQSRLTCVAELPTGADCAHDDDNTHTPATSTEGDYVPCSYHALANAREYESNIAVGVVSQCAVGFEFNDTVCTCLKVAEGNCSDDMLLHFPFTDHFNDVTCKHAQGDEYGHPVIVHDADIDRNVAEFDGSSNILVPFMRNWFKDQYITEWTVMMWFKREAGSSDDVGLVNNADCVDDASFAISGHVIAGNQQVSGAIAATIFPPVMVGPHTLPQFGEWHHVALTYDGQMMRLYLDNALEMSQAQTGFILNNQNAMNIAMCACDNANPGYFQGRMSELQIYTRVLTPPFY